MKFLLAGINHETNTFHSIPTKYENFEKSGMLLRGKEIEKLYDTPSTIGGFYNASQQFGFELVPLLFATTGPLGCLLYTSPSPRDGCRSRMPSSA